MTPVVSGPIRLLGDREIRLYMEETTDLDGQPVKVSQSSLATEDAVRIYVGDACAHLGFEHAYLVRDGLTRWLNEFFPDETAHLDAAEPMICLTCGEAGHHMDDCPRVCERCFTFDGHDSECSTLPLPESPR